MHFVRLQTEEKERSYINFFGGLTPKELDNAVAYANINFLPPVKEFLTAKAVLARMYIQAKTNSVKDIDPQVSMISNEKYKTYLLSVFNKLRPDSKLANGLPEEQILYTKIENDSITFKRLINQQKVLLIDFWATWCVPCLEEFTYTKRLISELDTSKFGIINKDVI